MYNKQGEGVPSPKLNNNNMKHIYLGYQPTQIVRKPEEEGLSLEEQIREALAGNEPIEANAPMIYTDRADEVQPEFDIRTDRFDLALEATDKFSKSQRASTDEPQPKDETAQPKQEPAKTE